MKPITYFVLCLFTALAIAASSDRIVKEKVCNNKTNWALKVYDIIVQNPKVILSGTDEEDVNAFAFIRNWIAENKTRDDLLIYVLARCLGAVEI